MTEQTKDKHIEDTLKYTEMIHRLGVNDTWGGESDDGQQACIIATGHENVARLMDMLRKLKTGGAQ